MAERRKNRIFTKKSDKLHRMYSGSPYWNWLFKYMRDNSNSGVEELREPDRAKADLSEEGSLLELYKDQQKIEERKNTLKYILRTAIENCGLAEQERIVVQRIIYDNIPTVEVAKELNVDHSAVSHALKRAIEKIKRKVKTLAHKFEI